MTYPDRIPALRDMARTFPPMVETLANVVLDSPGFRTCTGSVGKGKHHYGEGGLQQHIYEVVTLAMDCCRCSVVDGYLINRAHLFLAATWHDHGKVWDYQRESDPMGLYQTEGLWGATPHRRAINHINRSAIEWSRAAQEVADHETHDEVLHAILAHHGDYGSSLLPKSRVAWMLHLCDQMSARLHDADTLDLSKRP